MTDIEKLRYDLVRLWCKIKKIEEEGGTGGTMPSKYLIDIFEGNNIKIDKTDPKRPVISTTVLESLTSEFIVSAPAGSMEMGETFPGGLTLAQAFELLLTDIINPTYVAPTYTLTNNAGTREIGEVINLIITGTFSRGQIKGDKVGNVWKPDVVQNPRSGLPNKHTIGGTEYVTTSLIQTKTYANYIVGSETFQGTVDYDAGPIPHNSAGTQLNNRLPAGSLSASTTVNGVARIFIGSVGTRPQNGQDVRNTLLATSVFNTGNSYVLKTGTVNRIFVIAIPSAKTLDTAINTGTNEKLQFELSDITTVPNASGVSTPYKVYILTNDVPFSNDYTVNITLR